MGIILGYQMRFSSPKSYGWDLGTLNLFDQLQRVHEGSFEYFENPMRAAEKSDVLYTDTFVSMGEEDQYAEKIHHFSQYQINKDMMQQGNPSATFMHCLPAHRGSEVTDEVIDSPQSLVYDQAEARMIVSKGLFTYLLSKKQH
jgi:ornithine carbamoyltransferase